MRILKFSLSDGLNRVCVAALHFICLFSFLVPCVRSCHFSVAWVRVSKSAVQANISSQRPHVVRWHGNPGTGAANVNFSVNRIAMCRDLRHGIISPPYSSVFKPDLEKEKENLMI